MLSIAVLQPPPAPRSKSKMDTLVFMPEPIVASEVEENVTLDGDLPSISQMGSKEKGRDIVEEAIKVDLEAEKIERPVDLYKV
jgi:G patch domain-containing protein 1